MSSNGNPLEALYREVILQHSQHPRNRGMLADAGAAVRLNNPSCGDRIELFLKVSPDQRVEEVRFEGRGCSISQASASMMTERVRGLSLDEALGLAERFRQMVRGDAEAAQDERLGDLVALQGVSRFPVRVKCAVLAWEALERSIDQVRHGGDPS
ncbi:Fe-S cluster assembly sulfur transfer protein SufU [Limnochorda pilosa]|uniref:Nitrogen-fixing protein NifU n=1 Tax=Limnochorda pilosa TaxID=1555112 RepID=A0A0K2SJG7_LIMPI|nr:SUF system NifU family Fe-S cluster assembly protein [Limnochorda pilosa]BAS27253.1 nitrogen-fixing protein NifU [Limnochorda pilosa]